jgi:magnesium chelatase family protein
MKPCTCSQGAVQKYLQRISGPLLDRIDIHIEVPRLDSDTMTSKAQMGEGSATIRLRVEQARQRQAERLSGTGLYCNAHMGAKQIQRFCEVQGDTKTLLRAAITQMSLSARAYDRILKLARTIADLAGEESIGIAHVAEAVQYRSLDRKFWG